MFKKLISLIVITILITYTPTAISLSEFSYTSNIKSSDNTNFTHTVFGGIAFTQGCGPCHDWNQIMFDTYESENYDFQYASMIVYDKNGDVLIRKAYDWDSNYEISTYPTSIFDGDYERIVGNHPELLNNSINTTGSRNVSNIIGNVSMNWVGNASVNISYSIKNNESSTYNGTIKIFMTEIVSRYKTSLGDPFNFGFLDFPIDENISIESDETYSNSTIWNGNEHEDEHGNDFGDINAHNIKIILVVYNETTGYAEETVFSDITNTPPIKPNEPYPANGSTGVDINVDLSWICEDPQDDPLTYDLYFGEDSTPPKVASNLTNSSFDPGKLNITQEYYWKIVAWDNYNASTEGPIWYFKTRINTPPANPKQPDGPSDGSVGVNYEFSTKTTDMDNDQVFYKWDWGDGNYSDWLGPYLQNTEAYGSYAWSDGGNFSVRVKAKDIVNSESNWSNATSIHIVKPKIEIDKIKGGISKIKVTLNNIGDGEANEINWKINLIGGFILRGYESSGTISKISPEEQYNITSSRIFGLGRTDVKVTIETSDGNVINKTENGIVIFFFVRV